MSTAWLKDLEEKVQEAAKRLRQAREENAGLTTKVEKLEAELAETGEQSEQAEAWQEERDDIRQRVGRLVDHLEELLGD